MNEGSTSARPPVVVTAAAHRGGKHVALRLAEAGFDLAFWGLAAMRARSAEVVERGGRAVVCRGNIKDSLSVRFMLRDTTAVFPRVFAVVHVAADHLNFNGADLDPATAALIACGAERVVYVDDGELASGALDAQRNAAEALGATTEVVAASKAGKLISTDAIADSVTAALQSP